MYMYMYVSIHDHFNQVTLESMQMQTLLYIFFALASSWTVLYIHVQPFVYCMYSSYMYMTEFTTSLHITAFIHISCVLNDL